MTIDKAKIKWEDDVPKAPDAAKVEWDKPKSSTLPANAGLANFIASAVGLPVDTVENVINLTRAAQGSVAGEFGATNWMPPLLKGSVGGSEWIKGVMRKSGLPGLSPDNPAPQSKTGTTQYDFVSRGGFIPGGAIPAAGSIVAENALGPQWAGVGAMAPQGAITAYNAARAPSLAAQESRNSVGDATLREGRQAGLVLPPSEMNAGPLTNIVESFGGKIATGQKTALKNQEVTTDLARRDLGLPNNAPVSMAAIERRREVLAAPYRELAKIDAEAASTLEKLRQARFDANAEWKFYHHTPNPEVLAKAKKLDAEAARLEEYLETIAVNAGKPNLVPELRDARREIAKTFDVEQALNVATGQVSAPTLGKMVDAGKPLTGGLSTAGRFQQAYPHHMREGEKVTSPDVSATNMMASSLLGYGGFQAAGWPGLLAAGLPFLRGGVRSGLLSSPVQNGLMPNYGPALRPAPSPQLLYQLGIIERQ